MEILLLQDIRGVGKKNDLLVVGDGYAMNHLLPQQMAIVATPTVRRRYAETIRERAIQREQERAFRDSAAGAVEGKEIVFERKVTKAGKLYAAITEKHIVEALKKQHSAEVTEKAIELPEPIKALGEFEVVAVSGEQKAAFNVVVKEEK